MKMRVCGKFKGLIRVLTTNPRDEKKEDQPFDFQSLLIPAPYRVRLYVLKGLNLAAMDPPFNGRPGKSDPYMKVLARPRTRPAYRAARAFFFPMSRCEGGL